MMSAGYREVALYLLARVHEDFDRAKRATPGPWEGSFADDTGRGRWSVTTEKTGDPVAEHYVGGYCGYEEPHGEEGADAYFIAGWSPDRVIRHLRGKQAIISDCMLLLSTGDPGENWGQAQLQDWARQILDEMLYEYAGRADFKEEWR